MKNNLIISCKNNKMYRNKVIKDNFLLYDIKKFFPIDKSNLFYESDKIFSDLFGKEISKLYADFTASGIPCKIIEDLIQKRIYGNYANTHSNSCNGILMKNYIQECRNYVRQLLEIDSEYKIIFTGNGTTSAINHLVKILNIKDYKKVHVYLSVYEHLSNHLPWVELYRINKKKIVLHLIPLNNNDYDLDYLYLQDEIMQKKNEDDLIIVSVTACSNVNGKIINLTLIKNILKTYSSIKYYLFVDYACLAPYKKINIHEIDAIFFSPHKFIGGTSTPGILICKEELFQKSPFICGGGCSHHADLYSVVYDEDIEKKESAGTPNIIGIIKFYYCLQLKEIYYSFIQLRENYLVNMMIQKIKEFKSKYKNVFFPILYNVNNRKSLPILSFALKNLHYNYVVILLNDLFGIQSRGGNSCAILLKNYICNFLENNQCFKGWVRISFHWTHSNEEVLYIYNAIEYIINNSSKYVNNYHYIKEKNLYEKK